MLLPYLDGFCLQFCQTSVEPMGEESDHVHITALTDALGVPVRIVYLDRSGGSSEDSLEINHHDFLPESDPDVAESDNKSDLLTLLYRPGHYDILYRR
jgi:ubiquitin thioesterase protein OTUB1